MGTKTIIEAMASTLWASAWADHVDEHECCSLSGRQIEAIMPPIPQAAYDLANQLAGKFEQANVMPLVCLYARAMAAKGIHMPDDLESDWDKEAYYELCELFGSDMAMEAMGTGVAWSDDNPDFEHVTPDIETYELMDHASEQCTNILDVEYTWTIEPESEDFVGNCMASDDPEVDAEQEQWVRDQLASGNVAAWCCFTVTATRADGATGSASLGCCSYASVADLVRDELDNLSAEALADLQSR